MIKDGTENFGIPESQAGIQFIFWTHRCFPHLTNQVMFDIVKV